MTSIGPFYRSRDMTAADPEIAGLLPVRGQTWQRVIADANFALAGIAHATPIGGTGWSGAADEVVTASSSITYLTTIPTVNAARTYVVRVLVESTVAKPNGAALTIMASVAFTSSGAIPLSVYDYGIVVQEILVQITPAVGIDWTVLEVDVANAGPDDVRIVGIGCEALPLTVDTDADTTDPYTARARAPIAVGGGAAEVAALLDTGNASMALMRQMISWIRSTSSPATFTTLANLWTLAQPALAAPRFIGETTRRCTIMAIVSSTLTTGTSELDVSLSGGGSASIVIANGGTTPIVIYGSVSVPVETTATDGRSGSAWSDVTVSAKANAGTLSVYAFALLDVLYNGLGPSGPPVIAGTVATGHVLACYYWGATAFAWQRAGVPISGATSQSYTCVGADTPGNLTCIVTAEDGSTHTSNVL